MLVSGRKGHSDVWRFDLPMCHISGGLTWFTQSSSYSPSGTCLRLNIASTNIWFNSQNRPLFLLSKNFELVLLGDFLYVYLNTMWSATAFKLELILWQYVCGRSYLFNKYLLTSAEVLADTSIMVCWLIIWLIRLSLNNMWNTNWEELLFSVKKKRWKTKIDSLVQGDPLSGTNLGVNWAWSEMV